MSRKTKKQNKNKTKQNKKISLQIILVVNSVQSFKEAILDHTKDYIIVKGKKCNTIQSIYFINDAYSDFIAKFNVLLLMVFICYVLHIKKF